MNLPDDLGTYAVVFVALVILTLFLSGLFLGIAELLGWH